MNKKSWVETGKFILRLALLVGVPLLVAESANFTGQLETVFQIVLPIVLPIIDKFVHEDERFTANGIVPF